MRALYRSSHPVAKLLKSAPDGERGPLTAGVGRLTDSPRPNPHKARELQSLAPPFISVTFHKHRFETASLSMVVSPLAHVLMRPQHLVLLLVGERRSAVRRPVPWGTGRLKTGRYLQSSIRRPSAPRCSGAQRLQRWLRRWRQNSCGSTTSAAGT